MTSRHRPRRLLPGFTLVELIIGGAIATVLGTGLVYMIIHGGLVFQEIDTAQRRTSLATSTIAQVYKPIRLAREFPGSYTTSDQRTFRADNPDSTVIMKVAAIDSRGIPLCEAGKLDTIIFTQQGSNVEEVIDPHPESHRPKSDRVVMEKITTLTFSHGPGAAGGLSPHREVTIAVVAADGASYRETMVARND